MENKSILNEGEKEDIGVGFTVGGMPFQQFKRFKNYAKDWRDNYSVTIQVLMDKAEILEYITAGEVPEEVEYVDGEKKEEVQTLGDD